MVRNLCSSNMAIGPGLSLFLFCLSALLLSGVPMATKIGVTIGSNFHEARKQKFAIEAAAQLLNTSVSRLFLDVRLFNSSNPFEAALNARDLINGFWADAIISGGTWPDVAPVAELGSRAQVPVISLATQPPPRVAPVRFLVSTSYPPSATVRCMAELISSYNWRSVIVIYEDDNHGSVAASMVTLFDDALRAVGSDVDHLVAFQQSNSLPELRAAVRQKLKIASLRSCKVFVVVRASAKLALQLFKEARALGMMTKDHVWITDDETTDLLGSAFNSSVLYYMKGVVGIKAYFNKSTISYKNFEERLKQGFRSEHSKGDIYYTPRISSLRAYDAVQVIAQAAAATEKNRSSTFWEEILSSNFKGLSGHVQFKRHGGLAVRESSSLVFHVIKFGSKRYKTIRFWSERDGSYKRKGEQGHGRTRVNLVQAVRWPSGTRRVLRGLGKLKIGVPARTSFDQFVRVEYDSKGSVKSVTGFSIDVFKQTSKRLRYKLPYELVPFHGTYDELIDQVYSKKFDAAVGDITILANRLKKVEFTEPYLGSGLAMLVPVKPYRMQIRWVFMMPFTNGVWAVIVFIFAYTAIILWFLENKDNPEFNGSWKRQFGATLWLIVSTVFFAYRRIYSYYTRAVIMVWLFVALIIVQSYTATLSSILTTRKLETLVSDSRIGCDGDSFITRYLQDVLRYPAYRIYKIGAAEDYPKAFESGKITAAYMETPYLRLFLSRHKGYTVHGETHRLGGLGFVFPRGSPFVIDFSEAILQLTQEGALKDLEKKWFSFSFSNCPSPENDENRDGIGLDNMWGLFLLTGGTTTIVFLVFIFRRRGGQNQRQMRGGMRLKEKFKRIRRLRKLKKKEQHETSEKELETSSVPSNSLPGNTAQMERETIHDVRAQSAEVLPMATMPHHEYDGIEEEILGNQNNV